MSNIIYNCNTNFSLKREAFTYQVEAYNSIKDLDYSAIFHEQGLGKTKIAIDLMIYWLEKRNIDCVIVVTKKQLIANWEGEFHFHTYLRPKILTNNKIDNYYVFNSNVRVILTNFETISTEKSRLKLFLKTRSVAIIIDESTKIKNPDSKLTKDFFELSECFKIRTIMTGTPVANRPYDIWAQIYFLDNGLSLGTNFSEFKSNTNLSNDLSINNEKKMNFEKCVSEIFKKISKFTVRETKNSGIISLPNKIYHNLYCEFEPIQSQMYLTLKDELYLLVQKNDETILDENESSIKRLLRLCQIASNPRLIDESYCYESGKEKELKRIVSLIIKRNEKVIVWSNYIDNINYLYKQYKHLNPVRIHGSLPIVDRNSSVEKFKNDPDCKILFATPQSAKEGLTLTVANNVIFYDRGFNLDDYLQAQDRIHRISQKKECNVYNLMINDSIDVWIDVLLKAKQNAAFLAQGDYKLSKYSKEMDYSFGKLVKAILGFKEDESND